MIYEMSSIGLRIDPNGSRLGLARLLTAADPFRLLGPGYGRGENLQFHISN